VRPLWRNVVIVISEAYQFHHDVYQAVVEAVPLICPAKRDVIVFFKGAGLRHPRLNELAREVHTNRESVKKHDMAHQLLQIANEDPTDRGLKVRREILKRIVDFNNFDHCWPKEQLAAKGAVAKVRELVNEKDAFTRMQQAHDKEVAARVAMAEQVATARRLKLEKREAAKRELFAVFSIADAHKRGIGFECALNAIFVLDDILVREAFRLTGQRGEGVVEQIDGVIELDGALYLVEAKFWSTNLGVGDVSQHMVRVAHRGGMRGLFVVHPGYSPAAISIVRDSLQQGVFVLATVEELVSLLESEISVAEWLRAKIHHAMIDRDPHRLFIRGE